MNVSLLWRFVPEGRPVAGWQGDNMLPVRAVSTLFVAVAVASSLSLWIRPLWMHLTVSVSDSSSSSLSCLWLSGLGKCLLTPQEMTVGEQTELLLAVVSTSVVLQIKCFSRYVQGWDSEGDLGCLSLVWLFFFLQTSKSLYLHLLMFVLIVVLSFTLITLIINFSQSTFKTR